MDLIGMVTGTVVKATKSAEEDVDKIDRQIEIGFDYLKKVIKEIDIKKIDNESETRLKLIDDIFTKCLGWDKAFDVKVETRIDSKYIDYLLSTTRKILVIEAKKAGKYFDLPQSKGIPKSIKIMSLMSSSKSTKNAIEQVAKYSQSMGVPFCILTNGHQYIAFMGSREDGVNPFEGSAIVFSSLEQIQNNFILFWDLFSKAGLEELNIKKKLLDKTASILPQKLSTSLVHYPGTRHRNDLQANLQTLTELVLEDLLHEDLETQFLKECYCESGALSQYSLLARDIIKFRYYQDKGDSKITINRINTRDGMNKEFLEVDKEFLEVSLSRRPIVLLGDVGVGKTTFIRKLIKIKPEELINKVMPIYIDLGSKLFLTKNITEGITFEIQRILKMEYGIDINEDSFVRNVYKKELEAFQQSIYKSLAPEKFLEKEVETLANLLQNQSVHVMRAVDEIIAEGTNITIFLDNIDQRSNEDQQVVYLASQELAAHTSSVVFISLRPETFYKSAEDGALKAYHQKAFTIDPPKIDLVLSKRIDFGLKLASGEIQIPSFEDFGNTKLINLSTMLEAMSDSLKGNNRSSKELIQFIDNFAAGNVRIAVDMVKKFLSSGHTNSTKIINIKDDGEYFIAAHEFIKSIIYDENEHYDPNRSSIKNIFDINTRDEKEYFLKTIMIKILYDHSRSSLSEKGFIETDLIYETLQGLGFSSEQIDLSFNFCLKNELIESSINYVIDHSISPKRVRVTTKGVCYINLLINKFVYFDAIIIDIPIIDESVRSEVVSYLEMELGQRLFKAARVLEYMKDIFNLTIRIKNNEMINNFWDGIYRTLRNDIEKIYEKNKINKDQELKPVYPESEKSK